MVLKDDLELDDVNKRFIRLVEETLIPYLRSLLQMHNAKVNLDKHDAEKLENLKNAIDKLMSVEFNFGKRIKEKSILQDIENEIIDVKNLNIKIRQILISMNEGEAEGKLLNDILSLSRKLTSDLWLLEKHIKADEKKEETREEILTAKAA